MVVQRRHSLISNNKKVRILQIFCMDSFFYANLLSKFQFFSGEEEEDDPDFDPATVKNQQECKQQ